MIAAPEDRGFRVGQIVKMSGFEWSDKQQTTGGGKQDY